MLDTSQIFVHISLYMWTERTCIDSNFNIKLAKNPSVVMNEFSFQYNIWITISTTSSTTMKTNTARHVSISQLIVIQAKVSTWNWKLWKYMKEEKERHILVIFGFTVCMNWTRKSCLLSIKIADRGSIKPI